MMCDRCEELEEEVIQLRARVYGCTWEPPPELRLTAHEAAILQAMIAHDRVAPNWLLYEATRQAPNAQGFDVDPKIIQIRICHLRKKLAPFGMSVETVWARGYRLESESRHRLLNWNTEARAA